MANSLISMQNLEKKRLKKNVFLLAFLKNNTITCFTKSYQAF